MLSALIAEVTRGDHVESRHTGSFVVCDDAGSVVLSGGEHERAIFPRSAIKALQAFPLVASGAADRLGFTAQDLALACASHSGTAAHAGVARGMLAKAGRDETCLECGAHWPSDQAASRALAASGRAPNALHNNCSGKHAGFIGYCTAAGIDTEGYVAPDHPAMRAVTRAIFETTGARLAAENRATDGCSIPAFLMPMAAIATGFARFGTRRFLPAEFAAACDVLRQAAAAHPVMIAGEGRFDTEVMSALGGAVFVKTGAEGVHAGAIPSLGLGFALKADDGAGRAADALAAALLLHFLPGAAVLAQWARRKLINWNGLVVGEVRGCLHAARV
jgi:L-asparaginase II